MVSADGDGSKQQDPLEFIVKISLWLDSTPERFLVSE